MKNVSNYNFLILKKSVCSVLFVAFTLFSGCVFSATNENDVAEKISQYINKADINRELQISDENAINSKLKSKAKNKTIHSALRDHRRLSGNLNAGWLKTSSQTLNVSIPDTKDRAVRLSRVNAKQKENSLIVGLPDTGGSYQTQVTSDGTVVYVDDHQSTDVAVQSFDDSARILTILNGVNSPTEYSYPVSLPAGGKIVKSDTGGILVFSKNGSLIGGFATPWAVDSDGKQIPTHYDILGNSVVQVVDHLSSNPHYPVVADPWLWQNLIYSWRWDIKATGKKDRYGKPLSGNTLAVYPTKWARMQLSGYLVGVAGWNELYALNPKGSYSNQNLNINSSAMKDQYICHQMAVITMFKDSWNLDQWRKYVGLPTTIAYGCNPPVL